MPYARSKAARLREFARIGRQVRAAERELATRIEARNQMIIDDQAAPDRSLLREIAVASGISESAVKQAVKRIRDR